jgi:uncharacterized membrane protein
LRDLRARQPRAGIAAPFPDEGDKVDGTLLTTTFDYALPGGAFGKIADALIVKRVNARSLEEALHNFKTLVERQSVVT